MLVKGFFQKHGQLMNGYITEETVSPYMSNFWLQPLKIKRKRCSSHLRPCYFFWNLPYIQSNKNKGRKAVNKPLNMQVEMITNGLVPEILKEECLSSKSGSVRLLWGGNMCAEPGQMGHSGKIIVFKREYPRVFGLWLNFIKNGPTGRAPIPTLNILGGLMFTVWRLSLGGAQV